MTGTDDGLYAALLIRRVEETLLDLYGEGRISGTIHTCLGQEWTGVALAQALRPGDVILSNHRCHGHFLAWTDDVEGLFAEILGRSGGVCGGSGGSQHLAAEGFLSNGIIGGMAPVAAGMALAAKRAQPAPDGTAVVALLLGDGAMAQGVVFETLNAVAVFGLPLLIVCEINGIAQSTPVAEVQAGSAADRARAFGIPTAEVDGRNPPALREVMRTAVARIRREGGPMLLAVSTARLGPHSKGDDTRPADHIERLRRDDPLTRTLDADLPQTRDLLKIIDERIGRALAAALASAPATLVPRSPASPALPALNPALPADRRHVDGIRDGLGDALMKDERTLLLGEDIAGAYGGAFKATAGLSARFPGRVLNTAISEAGLVGMGVGLALAGLRPVVEIMFGDFLGLAFDQLLNHAAKLGSYDREHRSVPLIVRTPMGGRRGYGPTHSQSIEKHFLGIPSLVVLAPHHRCDVRALYGGLPTSITRPHLVIENKTAYGLRADDHPVSGFDYLESAGPYPTFVLRPALKADVSILCYGGMLIEVEKAIDRLFEEDEIVSEVVCPLCLHPFDPAVLRESIARSGRLLTVEEGQGFAGLGAEAIARLFDEGGLEERRPMIRRLSAHPSPIGASTALEAAQLPGAATIVAAVRRMMRGA